SAGEALAGAATATPSAAVSRKDGSNRTGDVTRRSSSSEPPPATESRPARPHPPIECPETAIECAESTGISDIRRQEQGTRSRLGGRRDVGRSSASVIV